MKIVAYERATPASFEGIPPFSPKTTFDLATLSAPAPCHSIPSFIKMFEELGFKILIEFSYSTRVVMYMPDGAGTRYVFITEMPNDIEV